MVFLNIEIKARCSDALFVRDYLVSNGADFKGVDEQTDTYFNVANGRLKLGNIENNLIYYERNDQAGPKGSHFNLVKVEDAPGLKEVLAMANGIKVVVKKRREIYFIDNVKFHIDEVPGPQEKLEEQCAFYLKQFMIKSEDLVEVSYSDMLLAKII